MSGKATIEKQKEVTGISGKAETTERAVEGKRKSHGRLDQSGMASKILKRIAEVLEEELGE